MKIFLLLFISFTSVFAKSFLPITLQSTYVFQGDRHNSFVGDDVAVFSDGSEWKIHKNSQRIYEKWEYKDKLSVDFRTDRYFFKREHHFLIFNHNKNEYAKAMLVNSPVLTIENIEIYYESTRPVYQKYSRPYSAFDGTIQYTSYSNFVGYMPSDPRKILFLSDGSAFVIKDKFQDFEIGKKVYLISRTKKDLYKFLIITGNEREAKYTTAKIHK